MLGCSIQRNKEDQNEQVKEKRIMSTSKQAGSVGGQMVKKMIEAYENGMK